MVIARIGIRRAYKILVKAWTPAVFAQRVEEEWALLKNGSTTLTVEEIERMMAFFNGSD